MEDLLEYFYSHFKNEDEFNKQYGMFAPIVEAYLETLVSYKFIKTKEPIDKLLKTNIKLVKNFSVLDKMDVDKYEKDFFENLAALTINSSNGGDLKVDIIEVNIEVQLPKKFDKNKDYSNLTLDEFLKNFEAYYPIEDANDKKDQLIKTIIHELNHATCHKQFIYEEEGKFITDENVLKQKNLYKLSYTEFAGGIRISDCIDGKVVVRRGGDIIHEAITEALAYAFVASKPIKAIRYTPKLNSKRSYEPYSTLIMLHTVFDSDLIFKAYFNTPTKKPKMELKKIVDCQDKVFQAFDKFKLLNDNSSQHQVDEAENELISGVSAHVNNVFRRLKQSNLENKKLDFARATFYNFLSPFEWVEKAFDYAKFKEKDHELANEFAKKFKQFREEKMKEFETYAEECKAKTLKGD